MTPLPQGFPAEARVENAGSVRLTQSGLGFLQNNLGTLAKSLLGGQGNGGVLTFNVPSSSGSAVGIDYTICPGGPDPNGNPPKCVAEIDVANAKLAISTKNPHDIIISGPLPVRLQHLPAHVKGLCAFNFCAIDTDIDVTLNEGASCPGAGAPFANIQLDVDVSIEIDADPAHSRKGYSKVKIVDVTIDQNKIQDSLGICGGFLGSILDAAKGLFAGQLIGPLTGTLKDQLEQQLCQKSNPMVSPACPDGSTDDNGTCKYADGSCVSIMLGTDGHMDLGSLLSSISPGTKGGLNFLFAAGGEQGSPVDGNLNPINSGATLGMYGGALPKPQSNCVKLANMDPPQGIPIPDEITVNSVTGWPAGMDGPHVGFALNERFFNYALSGMYDSGLLCIGVGGESLNFGGIAFNSDLFGLLGASSLKNLALQNEAAGLALVIRPGAPPTAAFGNGTNLETDPLIRIGLKQLSIDFYVWSLDRYIRFMTYTVDVDVPLNLTVGADGSLTPVIDKINLNNPTATNATLLSEDPATIAKTLTDLVQGQIGSALGGALPSINLNDQLASLGLTLNIPETVDGQGSPGLRKLSKGSDNYLGIFATLGLAAAPPPPQSHTSAKLVERRVDPAGLHFSTMTDQNRPSALVAFSSQLDDGSRAVEYQYRVDNGFWHSWTRKRELVVSDPMFRLEGKHKIEIRSRIAGEPRSTDPEPAVVDFVVDVKAPAITVKDDGKGKAEIVVKDIVSSAEAILVRYRLDSGAWSEWAHADTIGALDVSKASTIDVEAKDEEGLVGTAAEAIRGKPITGGSGCGCTVAGDSSNDRSALGLLGLLAVGVAIRFGKRRSRDEEAAEATSPVSVKETKRAKKGVSTRTLGGVGAIASVLAFGSIAGCNCGNSETTSGSGTTTTTTTANACDTCDTLKPGLAGEYSSAAVVDGAIWVAGYMEKAISEKGDAYQYGDLGVGKWNGQSVDWTFVDGVPEQEVDPKQFDPDGFRGGVTDPGDDVGLWTSIAANDKGTLGVAYYDRTNRALKFALQDGAGWKVNTVQQVQTSDIGRYAKLLWLNGAWNIAFLAIQPGDAGAVTSGVRVATSSDGAAWTFEDAVINKATPCAARFCASGTSCIKDTGMCTTELSKDACNPGCSSTQACIDSGGPTCADKHTANETETYPNATGDYIAVGKEKGGTLGIVFYDRVAGNLVAASKSSGQWVTAILDGETNGTDTGDVGIGATLAIDDSGIWHVAYSNGYDESVQYIEVKDGVPGLPETIDDGSGIEGTLFEDGRHIVGDDANIHVSAGGDIQVTYQDATAGTLHYAVGTASANGHSWAVKVVPQDGFAGAFSKVIDNGGQLQVMHWWRKGGEGYVGDVVITTP
ncbi:MAG: hypothetical protein U0441_38825 [Polyangiaceae bacterium]